MRGLIYIINTLATLYSAVLLLRLIMQLSRADFRNPIGRAIVQLTDPLIRPLRRVLPPAGRVDTASVIAVVGFTAAKLWLLFALSGRVAVAPLALLLATTYEVARLVLWTYFYSIVLNALLSFVAPGNYSPAQSLLASICDPVLNPIRRVIPSIAGLDLSPLWACIAIQALLHLLS
jgi:YggT family protein